MPTESSALLKLNDKMVFEERIDFSDLRAIEFIRHELSAPYFAYVNKTQKVAWVFNSQEWAVRDFERGVQGRIWIDASNAWNVAFCVSKDKKTKSTYIPINEVLSLLGYNK